MELIRAAGGLVWRRGSEGWLLALVRKASSGAWTLPKGRLRPEEDFHQGAVREVQEETGCTVTMGDFAGSMAYESRRGPKLVLFWHMQFRRQGAVASDGEIDAVEWLTPKQALRRLELDRDREVLRRALREGNVAAAAAS